MSDMAEKAYVSGIRALGILYKAIMEPFWTILLHKGSVLDLNQHLRQMQVCMEKWEDDASPLPSGESCFPDLNTEKQREDDVYSEVDPELEAYTEMALELLCGQLLLVLERQAKSQLPGGKYWETSEAFKKTTSHVKKTNIDSERNMAMRDFLLKTKPTIKPLSLETYIMWLQNKPSQWLSSMTNEQKNATLDSARAAAPNIKSVFKQRKDVLIQKKKEQLEATKEKRR